MKTALKQFVTMFLTIGLMFVPALQAQQQSQSASPQAGTPAPVLGNGPPPPPGLTGAPAPGFPSGISTGLIKTATSTLMSTQVAVQNQGYVTTAQIATVSTTLQNVFANFEDSGWPWVRLDPAAWAAL